MTHAQRVTAVTEPRAGTRTVPYQILLVDLDLVLGFIMGFIGNSLQLSTSSLTQTIQDALEPILGSTVLCRYSTGTSTTAVAITQWYPRCVRLGCTRIVRRPGVLVSYSCACTVLYIVLVQVFEYM